MQKRDLQESKAYVSPNRLAFVRFTKNKPAVISSLFILLCIFIALFAYQIVPDSSPNANRQIPEFNLAPLGHRSQVLKLRNNFKIPPKGFLSRFFLGQEDIYTLIPVEAYRIQGDSIHILKNQTLYKKYHLVDVAYSLKAQTAIQYSEDQYTFETIDGQVLSISKPELSEKIKSTHLPNKTFLLGTDQYGRDVFSRLIIGVRISLLAGLIAVIISVLLGTTLGMLAGFYGGKVDSLISFFINTVWSIPTLLLVFAIVIALGKSITNIFLAVGLTMWVEVARIVRGQVLTLQKAPYIEAMKVMGTPMPRIMLRHLLPNLMGPLLVIAAANFATAILLEAGLSYLGFGIQPPTPSWGTMLNEHYGFAISGKPMLALIPALAILLLVLSFNLVGNGLRDALDVKE